MRFDHQRIRFSLLIRGNKLGSIMLFNTVKEGIQLIVGDIDILPGLEGVLGLCLRHIRQWSLFCWLNGFGCRSRLLFSAQAKLCHQLLVSEGH